MPWEEARSGWPAKLQTMKPKAFWQAKNTEKRLHEKE